MSYNESPEEYEGYERPAPDLLGMKEDRYVKCAKVLLKKMERIVDQANWEHTAFIMLAADVMRSEIGNEPKWLSEALNQGDGTYKP